MIELDKDTEYYVPVRYEGHGVSGTLNIPMEDFFSMIEQEMRARSMEAALARQEKYRKEK